MARQKRKKAEYLHVVIRGIGKQILFEEDSDRQYFISLLKKNRDICCTTIIAYCLMENHVHLLLHNESTDVSLFMKKVEVSYALYYNKKYERIGHLFQDRFRSEIISNDAALLAVFRYILNNPQKAGIARSTEYQWSSIREYGRTDGITDSTIVYNMIGEKEELYDFLKVSNKIEFIEDLPSKHDDEWGMNIIHQVLCGASGTTLQGMSKIDRNETLALLKSKGLSVRQLERLTGINRGVVQKAKASK